MRVILILFTVLAFWSCASEQSNSWKLLRTYQVEDSFRPLGVANFLNYLVMSDSAQDRIIFIDTTDLSYFHDLKVSSPMFIRIRSSSLLMPSYESDTIFAFKGRPQYSSFSPKSILKSPTAIDAFKLNHFAIADRGNDRILYTNNEENTSIVIGPEFERGVFDQPSNVLLYHEFIYVVDSGNRVVRVFNTVGRYLFEFGIEQEMEFPTGICMHNDTIFISDATTNSIHLYDYEGQFIESINENLNGPTDINYFEGKLYVANHNGREVVTMIRN